MLTEAMLVDRTISGGRRATVLEHDDARSGGFEPLRFRAQGQAELERRLEER